jgi:type VI secretion system protein ImpE
VKKPFFDLEHKCLQVFPCLFYQCFVGLAPSISLRGARVKAKELLDANQLSAAISELTQDVKAHPTDTRLRTFLFEALCFQGDYQRAEKQLEVIGVQNEKAGIGIEIYRSLLQAEAARRRVFQGASRPTFLLSPPEHVNCRLDGLLHLSRGETAEAKELLSKAVTLSPKLSGKINGNPFSSFRDSDDRISSILEVFIKNTYAWIPFEQIRQLQVSQPKNFRDLLWVPATIEIENGQGGEAYVPALYSGSEEDENEQVRLGRITEWINLGEGMAGGIGQRTFIVDDKDTSILELQNVEFILA